MSKSKQYAVSSLAHSAVAMWAVDAGGWWAAWGVVLALFATIDLVRGISYAYLGE